MKRFIIILFFCSLLLGAAIAQNNTSNSNGDKQKIVKIQNEISKIKKKITAAKNKQQKTKLQSLLKGYENSIQALKNRIAINQNAATSFEAVSFEAGEELAPATVETKGGGRGINFELGVNGGIFYGGNIWLGEIRTGLPMIIGPARSSLRLMTGLVQSPDQDRKFIPVYADIILNYPPGIITGTNNYFGAGLNYVALTTGRKAGSIGGEIFYGVEADGFNGKLYGEVGYQVIRTGFSASEKGISLLIGYRIPVSF